MKKITLLLLCFALTNSYLFAQTKAVTELGEEVFLYEDGTWKYAHEKTKKDSPISTNPKKFKKHKTATFLLKSSKFNIGFWLNPKAWSFKKDESATGVEYELKWKEGDLYAMILTEKLEIPLNTLKEIALDNARDAAPDIKIIKEEYRKINGLNVLFIQMNGTMKGIKFSYYGYYYSNQNGTVQFVTYTSQNLLGEYQKDCEILLNGLVEISSKL